MVGTACQMVNSSLLQTKVLNPRSLCCVYLLEYVKDTTKLTMDTSGNTGAVRLSIPNSRLNLLHNPLLLWTPFKDGILPSHLTDRSKQYFKVWYVFPQKNKGVY